MKRTLFLFVLIVVQFVVATGVAAQQNNFYYCWIEKVSAFDQDGAVIKFRAHASAFVIFTAVDGTNPEKQFLLSPENTGSNGGNSVLRIPKGKIANLMHGHESCAIRLAQDEGVAGVNVSAVSRYVAPGALPRTVQMFIPFDKN